VVAADGHMVTKFRGYSGTVARMLRDGIEKALNPAFEPSPPRAPSEPLPRPSPSSSARP
jgi:hypothetical protein